MIRVILSAFVGLSLGAPAPTPNPYHSNIYLDYSEDLHEYGMATWATSTLRPGRIEIASTWTPVDVIVDPLIYYHMGWKFDKNNEIQFKRSWNNDFAFDFDWYSFEAEDYGIGQYDYFMENRFPPGYWSTPLPRLSAGENVRKDRPDFLRPWADV